MNIEIACLRCNDFFLIVPGEAERFIKRRANQKLLQGIEFPEKAKKFFSSRKAFIKRVVEYHCPNCREAGIGKPPEPSHSRKPLSEDKYLRAIEKEMRNQGGFQFSS